MSLIVVVNEQTLKSLPNFQLYNTEGAPTENADLIAHVDSFDIRRSATGRLPIANIDGPAFLDVIAQRRDDVLAD